MRPNSDGCTIFSTSYINLKSPSLQVIIHKSTENLSKKNENTNSDFQGGASKNVHF